MEICLPSKFKIDLEHLASAYRRIVRVARSEDVYYGRAGLLDEKLLVDGLRPSQIWAAVYTVSEKFVLRYDEMDIYEKHLEVVASRLHIEKPPVPSFRKLKRVLLKYGLGIDVGEGMVATSAVSTLMTLLTRYGEVEPVAGLSGAHVQWDTLQEYVRVYVKLRELISHYAVETRPRKDIFSVALDVIRDLIDSTDARWLGMYIDLMKYVVAVDLYYTALYHRQDRENILLGFMT
jgi:hypothetical protein